MDFRYLLGIALATASAVAACGGPTSSLDYNRGGNEEDDGNTTLPGNNGSSNGGNAGTGNSTPAPTNSPAGQKFFVDNVFGFLSSGCGACHGAAGPGPAWLTSGDAQKSYTQLFQVGYVVRQSRIILKGAHGGVTNNVLTNEQIAIYNEWVETELKDGGTKAPPNVLEKLGGCLDRTKFDAMQLGQWRTTRRTNNNNTNQVTPWNENANNCTGCDNAPCTTCHSADAASGFVNAVGNNLLPADYTFDQTKLTAPAYLQKYFGVDPTGEPIASDAIKKKSDATKKDKAYTHPMYSLSQAQETALKAFVDDAIAKYKAGTCAAPTTP